MLLSSEVVTDVIDMRGFFTMAGSKKNVPLGWKSLRQGLHIEPEQRVDEKGAVYFGCRHVVSSIKLPNGG